MKYCFIVSSAIYSSHTKMVSNSHMDLYNPQVRFNQTVETLASIKNKVDCDIFIVESSVTPLNNEQLEILKTFGNVFQYSSEISRKVYSSVKKHGKLQNSIEFLAMYDFLRSHKQILSEYKRIFKLSGRYKLSKDFQLYKHDNQFVTNKFLFVGSRNPVLQSRLYSFDSSLIDYHIEVIWKSLDYMTEIGNASQNYVDIETCFKKFIEPEYLIQTRVIGVDGNIAVNGDYINE